MDPSTANIKGYVYALPFSKFKFEENIRKLVKSFVQVNYVMNTLLSMNMVIAFIMAVVLDNTVPGSRQERGVYVWSDSETVTREPGLAKDYELPFRVGRFFRWVKWVGI